MFFNIDNFSFDEVKAIYMDYLRSHSSRYSYHMGQYIFALDEKEINKVSLTEKEAHILLIARECEGVYGVEFKEQQEFEKKFDNLVYAEESLNLLLKNVSIDDIMKEKPSLSDIPQGMKCMALKIKSKNQYEWVWSAGILGGSEFIFHESVDGSVEADILKMKTTSNQQLQDTGCKCSCHKFNVLHMMSCCSMTYKKMFTHLIK